MSSYVQSNLLDDEKIVYSAKPSLWAMAGRIVLGGFFTLCGLAAATVDFGPAALLSFSLAALWLGSAAIKYLTTELVITNKRVFAKFGFVRRTSIELLLARVESVQIRQSILGRLLNYGSVLVAGAGMFATPVPYISDPMRFRVECTKAQQQAERP